MLRRSVAPTAFALFLFGALAPYVHADGEPYAWAISASATDPFVQTAAPLPEPGVVELHLWLVCDEVGSIAAAEFGVTEAGNLDAVAFNASPAATVLFDSSPDNLRFVMPGSPSPPYYVGSLLTIDFGGGGSLCLGPSAGKGINVSVDAGYPLPTAHPNGHLGFSSDGSDPCASGDCVDPATPVGEIETSTWGRIKDTYR